MSQGHNVMSERVTETVEALRDQLAIRDIGSLALTQSGGTRGSGESGAEGGGGGAGPRAWAGFIVSGASTHLAKDRLSTALSGEPEAGGGCAGEPRVPSPSPVENAPLAEGGVEPAGGVVVSIAPLGLGTEQVAAWLREMLLPEEVLSLRVDHLIPA